MDYPAITILSLVILSFIAGFIDAVVGGGGLIQLPAVLINFPSMPLATVFGTNKIAGLSGTTVAAFQYSRKIKFNYKLLFTTGISAAIAALLGARLISNLDPSKLKPVILFALIVIAIYTFIRKDLGSIQRKKISANKEFVYALLLGIIIGFYDGFIGPGTGSFLVLGFVVLLGFEFVTASAYAKVINCMTNIGALSVFISNGNFVLELAILMAVSNVTGSIIGTRMSLRRGNEFVRIIFLVIVIIMIVRYGYDVYFGM
jgi:uncharacterized membrane protein YfcA